MKGQSQDQQRKISKIFNGKSVGDDLKNGRVESAVIQA